MPRSLVWSTELDVLAFDHVVEQHPGYLVVRSPSHPEYYWGNLLLFDEPPAAGEAARWERTFDAAFAEAPRANPRRSLRASSLALIAPQMASEKTTVIPIPATRDPSITLPSVEKLTIAVAEITARPRRR